MDDSHKTYSLDDGLNRGHPSTHSSEKPILKEEQKRVLERLLQTDMQHLSDQEKDLMEKLLKQLDEDTQRVKNLRKRMGPKSGGPIGEYLEALKQETEKQPKGLLPSDEPIEERQRKTPTPWKEQEHSTGSKRPPSAPGVTSPTSRPSSSTKIKKQKRRTTPAPSDVNPGAPPERKTPLPRQKKPAPSQEAQIEEVSAETKKLDAGSQTDPVDTVKKYIMAWNQKAFAAEFECFSPSYLKMKKEDYVERRMATYLTYNRRGDFKQDFGQVLKKHIEGNKAEILCTRMVREFHMPNRYLDLYQLRLEDGKWRIRGVSTELDKEGKGKKENSSEQSGPR
jgi:hypothetical protein